jgi:hypothetical protein
MKTILCTALLATTILTGHDRERLSKTPKTTPKTAIMTAAAGASAGIASIAGLGWLCNYLAITDIPIFFGIGGSTNIGPVKVNAAAGARVTSSAEYIVAGCGLAVGCLAAWLTYRYTPEGKFGRAHGKLTKALFDETLNNLIAQEQKLISNIADAYIHSHYPRVAAHNDFLTHLAALEEAELLFRQASLETDNHFELIRMARECRVVIETYITTIKRCIQIIRTSPDWQKELKGYNTMLARQAQERAALAAQQIASNGNHHYLCMH